MSISNFIRWYNNTIIKKECLKGTKMWNQPKEFGLFEQLVGFSLFFDGLALFMGGKVLKDMGRNEL